MILPLRNNMGEVVGNLEVDDGVFNAEINIPLMHQAVVTYLANQRRGTASTKTRSEVEGSTRKVWRQKGTGRARHGSIRANIFVGGGVVFGPKPRSYRKKLPVKMKRGALRSCLSARVRDDELVVIDDIVLETPKTKEMTQWLQRQKLEGKILMVLSSGKTNVFKASSNIPNLKLIRVDNINIYDLLNADKVVFEKDALRRVQEVLKP